MKIVVCGTRGFPNIQGGIETHCEELYPRIADMGLNVTVIRRKRYVTEAPALTIYKGVKFKDINAPKINGFESAIHTFKCVFYAKKIKADILHIHAIGPSIVIPIARLLGLKVVMTHHGPDYDRKKWGKFAKAILKSGEYFAAKYANEIISISPVINEILKNKYNRIKNVRLIYNGVNLPQISHAVSYLYSLHIQPDKYILAVGRFVEEKNFHKLIDAYLNLPEQNSYRLVIAGDSDIESPYSRELKNKAKANGVILTGMIKGEKLAELYSHASLFVLPSSHEGLPITLLEAMSYKRKIVVSDIPANLSVKLSDESYFKLDDWDDLAKKMSEQLKKNFSEKEYDLSLYNWDTIAKTTINFYNTIHN